MWQILSLIAIALVTLTAFGFIEAHTAEPILPLRLFCNQKFVFINGIGFLMPTFSTTQKNTLKEITSPCRP
jgi:hypothetical protein